MVPAKFKLVTRLAAATLRCAVPSPNTLGTGRVAAAQNKTDQQRADDEEDQGQETVRTDQVDNVGNIQAQTGNQHNKQGHAGDFIQQRRSVCGTVGRMRPDHQAEHDGAEHGHAQRLGDGPSIHGHTR
jgi:hypothetical protein